MQQKIGDYILVQQLGKGTFGEVYLTKHLASSEIFATKKMSKQKVTSEKNKKYFNNEIFILRNIKHPNIMRFIDLKQSTNNFYLITEYCNGGSLADCLDRYTKKFNKPFPQNFVQYLMRQVVSGIEYLHSRKILHRDLKLDNILTHFPNENDKQNLNMMACKCKICDFGFARYLQENKVAKNQLGSPAYMDPNIFNGKNSFGYDQSADIWSLGALCYEMLTGSPPFMAMSFEELSKKLEKGEYKIAGNLNISQEAVSFLNGMLQYDCNKRLDIFSLAKHIFLTGDIKTFHPLQINGSALTMNTKISSVNNVWDIFGKEVGSLGKIDSRLLTNCLTPKEGNDFGKGIIDKPVDYMKDNNKIHHVYTTGQYGVSGLSTAPAPVGINGQFAQPFYGPYYGGNQYY